MGIFQSDLKIRTAIELGLEDLGKNPWLIQDILGECVHDRYLKDKYGQKQIDAASEWFKNNKIEVVMGYRNDKARLPCISIVLGSSNEKDEMKFMGDASPGKIILLPNEIGKPIPYIVPPFTPTSYNSATGEVGIDPMHISDIGISAGMILVNPRNGNGYVIEDVSADTITIQSGLNIVADLLAIVPQYQYYRANIEHSYFQETYNIGCHVHGDPQTLLWLHSIVLYSIMRYRESLLEAKGFGQSTISSSDMAPDQNFTTPGGEQAWARYITITGQVENTWIKTPRRIIESLLLKKDLEEGFTGGIQILSNLNAPPFIDKTQEAWYTVQDIDADDDENEED